MKGVEIEEPKDVSGGIMMEEPTGDVEPPLKGEAVAEPEAPAPREIPRELPKKVPLSPAVVKIPLRFEGQALAHLTGYPGWVYTEEDLNEIASLAQACGIEAPPAIQLVIALTGVHAAKFAGYIAWKKKGRPGDLRKEESVQT